MRDARDGSSSASNAAAQESPLSALDYIERIEHQNLARLELESKIRLAELAASAEERAEQRDYDRKQREAERERKRKAAEHMREIRAQKRQGGGARGVPPAARECEDCRARLEGRPRQHRNDMIRHATERHDLFFEPHNGAPN